MAGSVLHHHTSLAVVLVQYWQQVSLQAHAAWLFYAKQATGTLSKCRRGDTLPCGYTGQELRQTGHTPAVSIMFQVRLDHASWATYITP